jgi:acyl carrier protein
MNTARKSKIHAEVKRLLEENSDLEPLDDQQSLFSSGRLSSFAMMTLVMFLEQEFGMDFGNIDFDVSLVDSVNTIDALVAQQTG